METKEKQKKGKSVADIYNRFAKKTATVVVNGQRMDVRKALIPNAFDPNHNSYVKIVDAGIPYYCMSVYADKLPKEPAIAVNFARIMNVADVSTTIFINPLQEASIQRVDKRITTLETEEIIAENKPDTNRLRKLRQKKDDAEHWGRQIESGDNTFFEVGFLFQLYADSLDGLRSKAIDFNEEARNAGFVLANCYGIQKEAFLSGLPLNVVQEGVRLGGLTSVVKYHTLDKNALSTIFNHTDVNYYREDGVVIGHGLWDGRIVTWNPYTKGSVSYGTVVAGKTGYGKSLFIKGALGKMIEVLDLHVVCVDVEQRGTMGEYARLANAMDGVNFMFSSESKQRFNIFDINEEEIYDEQTGSSYRRLALNDKIATVSNMLMIIVYASNIDDMTKSVPFPQETVIRMNAIIKRIVRELYDEIGLKEGDADSLYEDSFISQNRFHAGRVKKRLPQMHDFFVKLVSHSLANRDAYKDNSYSLLLDSFADCVEELYYDPLTGAEYTKEQYNKMETGTQGMHRGKKFFMDKEDGKIHIIEMVRGSKSYLDGQTTVKVNGDIPFVNFDISQAPSSDKTVLMMLSWNYIREYFINRNSMNPKEAKKLAICIEEARELLKIEPGRAFVDNLYRTARKRHVFPIVIIQSLRDLRVDETVEGILKNAATFFVFKHDPVDESEIKEALKCTDALAAQIISLGGEDTNRRFGEMCLVDTQTKEKVFVQVDFIRETEGYIMETNQERILEMTETGER